MPGPKRVVIIGGGLMGCSAAWQLAQRGLKVTVLERSVPGAEASSAAAGILGAQIESHGSEAMRDLSIASRDRYAGWSRALSKATGIDIEHRQSGALRVTFNKAKLSQLRREFAWQRRRDLPLEFLTASALRKLEPGLGSGLAGAAHFPADARVDPRRLLKALQLAAAACGVQFVSGAYVQQLDIDSTSRRVKGVRLEGGKLAAADWVVVAAGSWTTLIHGVPLPRPSVQPARGQVLELTARIPAVTRVIFGPRCYLVPRDDGRVLVGSTLEFVGYEKRVTASAVRELLDAALDLVPALGDAQLTDSWSNFRPYTQDHAPILGGCELAGLVFATGHHRNGILLAPITADIVTSCVLGKRPPLDIDPFSARRLTVQASTEPEA